MNPWAPNGLGAGTDDSVAGGGGGYEAIPQPPTAGAYSPPENYGQFGPLEFTFSVSGSPFVINNPGR